MGSMAFEQLLAAMARAQSQLVEKGRTSIIFNELLSSLLELTESEYGFIGETHLGDDGNPYLKTHAITDISWNEETRRFYEENAPGGLEFRNLDSLFGVVLKTSESVIANHPPSDPRRGGTPHGHPPLRCFLGAPFRAAGQMVGMVGLANRPSGYDTALLEFISPLLQTCANVIYANRMDRERRTVEANLQTEQVRLTAIFDSALDPILTIDETGVITHANPSTERVFGYKISEIIGQNVSMLMPEPHRSGHDGYLKHYRDTGERRIIGIGRDAKGRRRNGEAFPCRISVAEANVEGRRMFTGFLRDLTPEHNAIARLRKLEAELASSRYGELVGRSEKMRELYERIERVGAVDWTVLIEGETGAGKELVARALHAASARKNEVFLAVNCAGLEATLLSSQLFGHRRGAFTGADRDHLGIFEAANGGTVLLDEIGDMAPQAQTALLRVLQEREVVRLGENSPRKVDVRVFSASNRDLTVEVAAGRFRADLLYRIRVARVSVPSLRDRRSDIPLLADTFLNQARLHVGRAAMSWHPDALARMCLHDWPGNVRELKGAVEYAVIHAMSHEIQAGDLPPEVAENLHPNAWEPRRSVVSSSESEKSVILATLRETAGNRTMAAKRLGMSRSTLYRRLSKLGVDAEADPEH